jgi:hypothetical protein
MLETFFIEISTICATNYNTVINEIYQFCVKSLAILDAILSSMWYVSWIFKDFGMLWCKFCIFNKTIRICQLWSIKLWQITVRNLSSIIMFLMLHFQLTSKLNQIFQPFPYRLQVRCIVQKYWFTLKYRTWVFKKEFSNW